jgi:hypothetical protein
VLLNQIAPEGVISPLVIPSGCNSIRKNKMKEEAKKKQMEPAVLYFLLNDQPFEPEFARIRGYIVPRTGELIHINVKDVGWSTYEVIKIRHFVYDEITWEEESNKFFMINIYVRKSEQ